MDLNKLFKAQAELDKHIVEEKGLQGQDLLKKKTVALICELYECINEARFFKFWSEKQSPNKGKSIPIECGLCDGVGVDTFGVFNERCSECDGTGLSGEYHQEPNPLLEEFADTLHFAISIANDVGLYDYEFGDSRSRDLNDLTLGITNLATLIPECPTKKNVRTLLNLIIKLGYQLGFTEDEVIESYHSKNKENHLRQETGY